MTAATGRRERDLALPLLLAANLVVGGGAGACAAPATVPQGMPAMAQDKTHWTAAERKLDSHIVAAARAAADTPSPGPGPAATRNPALELDARGRVHVDVQARVNPELEAAIVAAGGAIESSFPNYGTLRAWIPLSSATGLAARADVTFIAPAARGTTNIFRKD